MKDAPDDINTFSESEAIDLPSAVLQLLDAVDQLKSAIEARDLEIEHLKSKVLELEAGNKTEFDGIYISLTKHRKRLDKIEDGNSQVKNPAKKTEDRKHKLSLCLVKRQNKPLSFNEVGKLMELGSRSANGKTNTRKQNMYYFGKLLEQDMKMFVVSENKTSGGKLVCLTGDYYNHLLRKSEIR